MPINPVSYTHLDVYKRQFIQYNWVAKQDAGDDKMQKISTYIAEGAMAFLQAEWKILGYFVGVVALLLGIMASANPDSHWLSLIHI